MFKTIKQKKSIIFGLVLLVLTLFFLNIAYGAVQLSATEILRAIFVRDNIQHFHIVYNIRLPRAIVSVLVGISLSLSGLILQGVLRNSLATPNIIGVSAGAGLTALVIMILFPHLFYLIPLGAFVGAFSATMLIYLLAWKDGILPTRLILAGVAVSSVFGAGNDILLSFFPERVGGVMSFLIGGLQGITWKDVYMIVGYVVTGVVLSLLLSEKLNILALGDEVATGLGVNVERTRFLLIIVSSLLAGSAVSAVGLLGFVGLIVPHMSRIFVGSDGKYLVPTTLLGGAVLLQLCDLISRLIFSPAELPVGIIMSILGGPFFLYLLRKKEAIR